MTREEFAKQMFGRPGRVRLAEWILSRPDEHGRFFFQQEAVMGTQDVPNEVQQILAQFCACGLLARVSRTPGQRRQYYEVIDHPAWNIFRAALEAMKDLRPSREPIEVVGSVVSDVPAAASEQDQPGTPPPDGTQAHTTGARQRRGA